MISKPCCWDQPYRFLFVLAQNERDFKLLSTLTLVVLLSNWFMMN